MVSPNSCSTIDRALLAPRTLSWAQSVRALFGDLCLRVQGRMSRSRCEARVRKLAGAHPVGPVARPARALQPQRWIVAPALRVVAEIETRDL